MINRKLIRDTLRKVGAKADVTFLRKVRDDVYKRINSGETFCHICTSAYRINIKDNSVPDAMQKFLKELNGGGTMESVYMVITGDKSVISCSDDIRKVVLREMIDMNRNRKGTKC